MLPAYCKYVRENPHNLLPRYYGLYRLEFEGSFAVDFVCMVRGNGAGIGGASPEPG